MANKPIRGDFPRPIGAFTGTLQHLAGEKPLSPALGQQTCAASKYVSETVLGISVSRCNAYKIVAALPWHSREPSYSPCAVISGKMLKEYSGRQRPARWGRELTTTAGLRT